MFFMGIDLSLNRSAFVIINDKGKLQKKWILKNKRGHKGEKRLLMILQFVSSIVTTYGRFLNAIGIENYSFGARGRAIFNIGEAGGVARLVLYTWKKRNKDKQYYCIAPKTIKKFASGNGNSNKKKMIKAVKKKWKFDSKGDNDLADAFAVAMATRAFFYFTQVDSKTFKRFKKRYLTKADVEVLENISKKERNG